MHAEKLRRLRRRGFPGWEQDCEGQCSHHAVKELKIQLIWLWLDAWWWWKVNRVGMKPLAALRAVATNLRKLVSTGWTDFHARFCT